MLTLTHPMVRTVQQTEGLLVHEQTVVAGQTATALSWVVSLLVQVPQGLFQMGLGADRILAALGQTPWASVGMNLVLGHRVPATDRMVLALV